MFARFGSDADPSTKHILDRGACLTELLKQGQQSPYSTAQQVALLAAYRDGIFDGMSPDKVSDAKTSFLDYMEKAASAEFAEITKTGDMSEDCEKSLCAQMAEWKKTSEAEQ